MRCAGELGGFPRPPPKDSAPAAGSREPLLALGPLLGGRRAGGRRVPVLLCWREGRTSGSDFYSVNTLFKDILFYWRLCDPRRLHLLSVVHFRATLFQTKGQTKPNRARSVLLYPTLTPPARGGALGEL